MITHLSEIFMEKFKNDKEIEFILQIIDHEIKLNGNLSIVLSNGIVKNKFIYAMDEMQKKIEIKKYVIIKCLLKISNDIYFLLKYDIELNCDKILGNPIFFEDYKNLGNKNENGNNMIPNNYIKLNDKPLFDIKNKIFHNNFNLISELNTFKKNFVVKVRCVNKNEIKFYKKKEGKYFNCQFIDQSGSISAIFFNNEVDWYFDKIKINNIYKLQKFNIKNSTFNIGNKEIFINNKTIINNLEDDYNFPKINFNFVNIENIQKKNINESLDLMCIVLDNGKSEQILSKNGTYIDKRNIILVDNTEKVINLTLWNENAKNFKNNEGNIILFSNIKITEFNNNKQLSYTFYSKYYKIIPESTKYKEILKWNIKIFEKFKDNFNKNNDYKIIRKLMTIEEVNEKNDFSIEEVQFFSIIGYITYIKENFYYFSCINEECKKKVFKNNDEFECEKCNLKFKKEKIRYLPLFRIVDSTSSIYVTCLKENINNIIFGITCENLLKKKNNSEDEFNSYLNSRKYIQYKLTIKAKEKIYNGEKIMNYSIENLKSLNSNYLKLIYEYFKITI